MAEETWEIDVDEMTLDDLELIQSGIVDTKNAAEIKRFLASIITNKTVEEIGKVRLKDLRKRLEQVRQTMDELSIPKENATP